MADTIKLGISGVGNMGTAHVRNVVEKKLVEGVTITAIADSDGVTCYEYLKTVTSTGT